MFLTGFSVLGWFNNAIHMFLLWLDQSVYWFAAQCYQLFMKLATAQIFTDDFFAGFANRIYAILGVFMLFYLVYALLNAIVDPDKLTKGDKGVGKIASNLVVSLVLLGLMPSIFSYAYRMQNFVLSSNLLGAVILGSDVIDVSDSDSIKENEESLIRFGDYVSFSVLNAFLNPENVNPTLDGGYNWYGLKEEILKKGLWTSIPSTMANAVSNGVSIDGVNTVITYRPIISTAAGVFLIYILLSFTLDLGVRVVKFAFYQLLAPIPIILRIIPSKKGTFDKWLKQTLSVYFEVFIRVALMYIAIYFINAITTNNNWYENGGEMGILAFAILIMGVFAFAKQAPKIISDVLGLDTGNLKLGIKDKLKAGGFFGAGAAVGSLVSSRGNPFAMVRGWNAGNKDGNFQQIGKEAQLRNKVLAARAEGSTWMGRRVNDFRNFFGYDTTADALDREIERNKYKGLETHDGQRVNKEYIESNKDRLNAANAAIDEKIRADKIRYNPIEASRSATQAVLDSLKTSVERDTSKSTGAIKDLGYGALSGNYATMKKRIDEMNEAFRPDRNNYRDDATYRADFQRHQDTMALYSKALSDQKDTMQNELYKGILNNTKDHIDDVDVQNAIELSRQHHATMADSFDNLKTVRNKEKAQALEINREISALESQKINNTNELGELSRLEAQAEENVRARKHEGAYQARNADKNSRSK